MVEKPKRVTKAFRISLESLEQLDFMSKASNESRQLFIEKLLDELFGLVSCFKSAKLVYTTSILDSTIEIEVIGDSMLKIGEFEVKEKKVSKK